MRRVLCLVLAIMVVILLVPRSAGAQGTARDKYEAVQVERMQVQQGIEFPVDYLLTIQEETLKQMQEAKLFKEVLRPGEKPSDGSFHVLRMVGTITAYKAGSRAQRYVVGFGAGTTEVRAHVVFVDAISGRTLLTEEVLAQLSGGFIGGESMNVTRDFAKRIVTSSKVVLEKKLTEAEFAAAEKPLAPGEELKTAAADKPETKVVKFNSEDFPGSEKALNDEGAKGFRCADFAMTGKNTGDITLEKDAKLTFEYRIIHARLVGSVQKDMAKAADDGYRLCAPTVGQFGGVMGMVFMKPSVPLSSKYAYRVHQTLRVTTAQKHTSEAQAQGFVLAAATDQRGIHLVVLEKELKSGEASAAE